MEREVWTIEALKSLGYESDLCRSRCRCDELPCPMINWLVLELRKSCQEVEGKSGPVLAGELKEMLKAMFYPYDTLNSETLTPDHLKRITEFLVSELLAAYLLKYREDHPDDTEALNKSGKEQRVRESNTHIADETQPGGGGGEQNEKDVMKELAELYQALDLDEASQLSDAYLQVTKRLASLPEGEAREPLLKTSLNSSHWVCMYVWPSLDAEDDCLPLFFIGRSHWSKLQQMNKVLCKDYGSRRQMMIMRFNITLQSFSWGERGQEHVKRMSRIPPLLASPESSVSIAQLLAAREDQSRILPVTAGTSTAIHKVLMGSVPDRGGRPGEIEPPMPIFSRRNEGGDGQRHERNKKKREYKGKKKKKKNQEQ